MRIYEKNDQKTRIFEQKGQKRVFWSFFFSLTGRSRNLDPTRWQSDLTSNRSTWPVPPLSYIAQRLNASHVFSIAFLFCSGCASISQ